MTAIPALTLRADQAVESVGLTPYAIRSDGDSITIHDHSTGRWTVAQGELITTALGIETTVVQRYHPDPYGKRGFCIVLGTTPDGIEVSVFTDFEPEQSEAAA